MAIAFVTMIYNDAFFLGKWVNYYSKFTDRKNLHVICHGPQPYAEDLAPGCTFSLCERDPTNGMLDRDRFIFISDYCAKLLETYDRVIYNDVDEIILLDPLHGDDLIGHIMAVPEDVRVISPVGLEVIHRKDLEGDYDYSRDLFAQRKYVRMSGHYTKPSITNKAVRFGPDGHGVSHDTLHIDERLFTLHMKWFDEPFHVERFRQRVRMQTREDGQRITLGAGSWIWSESTYKIETALFLKMRIVPEDENFDFSWRLEQARSTFRDRGDGQHKIGWFKDTVLHVLPERFVGMI